MGVLQDAGLEILKKKKVAFASLKERGRHKYKEEELLAAVWLINI